jgi:hypothetical protein
VRGPAACLVEQQVEAAVQAQQLLIGTHT